MQPNPTERDSSALYTRRMNKVLDPIDRHLDQNLALADLAEVAHFSAFHFHRVFAAWMGETLGDYLRRRRLDVAALYLVSEPTMPVLEIALNVGFGSGEALRGPSSCASPARPANGVSRLRGAGPSSCMPRGAWQRRRRASWIRR